MVRSRRRRSQARVQEQIADRVRHRMSEAGVPLGELATKLEMTEMQLTRLLGGGRNWTLKLLFDTADALGCPVEALDPECRTELRAILDSLELRGDVPQLRVLHTFLQEFPKITEAEDLRALVQIVRSLADREPVAVSASAESAAS